MSALMLCKVCGSILIADYFNRGFFHCPNLLTFDETHCTNVEIITVAEILSSRYDKDLFEVDEKFWKDTVKQFELEWERMNAS